MNGLRGILLVLAVLGATLAALAAVVRAGRLAPEMSRKLVHLALGMTTLTFPWLFASSGPVWTLAALAVAALAALRWGRPVTAADRRVLLGVKRESYGELCFPVAVAVVFELSGGAPGPYLPAVAALTFADAAGALVGGRYGRIPYTTDEGHKTVEGSLAVLLITGALSFMLFRHVDGADLARSLIAGALVGLLTALIEAIAIKGFDNLFIPVLVWALLERYAELPTHVLVQRLAGLLLIAMTALFWLRRTRLNHAGILGVALLLYLAAVLGGQPWLAPPALAGLVYVWLGRCRPAAAGPAHTLTRAFTLAGPGLVWLILWRVRASPWIPPCFAVSFAAAVATMAVAEWGARGAGGVARAAALGAAVGLLGVLPMPVAASAGRAAAVMLCAGAAAAGLFHAFEWRRPADHAREQRWFIQGAVTAAVSLLGGLIR